MSLNKVSVVDDGRSSASVKSALRVLLIIELLTDDQDGLTFVQICERLSLPKSSAYALLQTMKERGHLDLDDGGRYRLGIRTWEAGQAWTRGFDLAAAARPYLQLARDELGETVQLAILDGIEIVYLAKEDSAQRLVLQSHVGARLPAYATGLGKVLLSGLGDDEIIARLSTTALETFTPHTIVDPSTLMAEIQKVRLNGYGMDYGEYTQGVICVAVPVFNDLAAVTTAVSVSVPEIRAGLEFQQRAVEVLTRAAKDLSTVVGISESRSS